MRGVYEYGKNDVLLESVSKKRQKRTWGCMRSSAALDSNVFVSLHTSRFQYGLANLGFYYSADRDLQGRARIPGQNEGALKHVCSRPIEKIPHASRGDGMGPPSRAQRCVRHCAGGSTSQ